MKNNLVPEPRSDRNGKVVVRHVKSDTQGPALIRSLPTRPPASPREKTVFEGESVFDTVDATSDPELAEVLRGAEKLGEFPPAFVAGVVDRLRDIGSVDDVRAYLTGERLQVLFSYNGLRAEVGFEDRLGTGGDLQYPVLDERLEDMFSHLMEHPEDYELIEVAVRRGALTYEATMAQIDEIKTAGLHSSLTDGFL